MPHRKLYAIVVFILQFEKNLCRTEKLACNPPKYLGDVIQLEYMTFYFSVQCAVTLLQNSTLNLCSKLAMYSKVWVVLFLK